METDVSALQQGQKHIIQALELADKAIKANAHNNEVLKAVTLKLAQGLSNTIDKLLVLEAAVEVLTLVHSLRDRVIMCENAVRQAFSHRLEHSLVDVGATNLVLKRLDRQAQRAGYELLVDQVQQLFQLEASLVFTPFGIAIWLHIPMARPGTVLDAYRLVNFPIELTSGVSAMVKPDASILAITLNFRCKLS